MRTGTSTSRGIDLEMVALKRDVSISHYLLPAAGTRGLDLPPASTTGSVLLVELVPVNTYLSTISSTCTTTVPRYF
jgi:hypothetical protein